MDAGSPEAACSVCIAVESFVAQLQVTVPCKEIIDHLQTQVEFLKRELGGRVGYRLRDARLLRNVSQGYLAKTVGLSVGHISKMEHGCQRGSREVLCALARALGAQEEWLLYGTAEMLDPSFDDSVLVRRGTRQRKPCVVGPDRLKVLKALDRGSRTRSELAHQTGFPTPKVSSILDWLSEQRLIVRVTWGRWALGRQRADLITGKMRDG